jgi:hypothetical protein
VSRYESTDGTYACQVSPAAGTTWVSYSEGWGVSVCHMKLHHVDRLECQLYWKQTEYRLMVKRQALHTRKQSLVISDSQFINVKGDTKVWLPYCFTLMPFLWNMLLHIYTDGSSVFDTRLPDRLVGKWSHYLNATRTTVRKEGGNVRDCGKKVRKKESKKADEEWWHKRKDSSSISTDIFQLLSSFFFLKAHCTNHGQVTLRKPERHEER